MIEDRSATLVAGSLESPVRHARELAERLGLDPYPVNFWIVDHDEMNQVIAYEGFQERYPHWRWGMQYDQRRKVDRYRAGKAYEIVNNDNPAHAFLQESNPRADQKAVITHVLAHADFFKHNEWFETIGVAESGPSAMIARHARRIRSYMHDPELDREEVERWIDHVLCLADTIDQHRPSSYASRLQDEVAEARQREQELSDHLAELSVSDEVRDEIFDEQWIEQQSQHDESRVTPAPDVLAFLRARGKQFDEEADRAVEMEEWQLDVIDILRAEAYYFAPQRMTKVMNEGWGAYYESLMMADEGFADAAEIVEYADHLSKVLGSGGLNPYALGKHLWEYIENTANRREVLERVLQVDGITRRTLPDVVDFDSVLAALEPPDALTHIGADTIDRLADEVDASYLDHDTLERAKAGEVDIDRYPWKVLTYEGLARRNYSLVKPQHRGFLSRVGNVELERIERYLGDAARYGSVDAAIGDVDFTVGWDRMQEVRESHNDVTFLDEFLTKEFVTQSDYFTYEFAHADGRFRVASRAYDDIKQKLLLMFTNFGKPRITVLDGNYENRNELLLGHHYNGIMLDLEAARRTLERAFELWGRPVNLKTVVKTADGEDLDALRSRRKEPELDETALLLRYDGETFDSESLPWTAVEEIADTSSRYDTTPAEWYE